MQSTNIFKISSKEVYLNLNRAIVFKNSLSPFEQEEFTLLSKFKTFSHFIEKDDDSIENSYQIPSHFKNAARAIKNENYPSESWQFISLTNLSEYCFCLMSANSSAILIEKLVITFGKCIIFASGEWTQFADDVHKSIVCTILKEVKKTIDEISSMMLDRAMFDIDDSNLRVGEIDLYSSNNELMLKEKYDAINSMIFFFLPCMIGFLVPGAMLPVGIYFLTSWLFTKLKKEDSKNERQQTNRKNIKRLLGRD